MTPIEQAREALALDRKALDAAIIAVEERGYAHFGGEIEAAIRAYLAALSPSTPVDGVGAEATELQRYIARCKELSNDGEYTWWTRLAEILSALASPEAEARLRERVDTKQFLEDVRAGKREAFVNTGEEPHGNGSDLDCPYCGGSGHKDDVNGPHAYGFEYNGEGYSATGAEARLAQAEGGPAVTEDRDTIMALLHSELGYYDAYDGQLDGINFRDVSNVLRIMIRRIEAALHPQSAAGEE